MILQTTPLGIITQKDKGPDFFLVGAPKCGTTAMNEFLAAHPDIFMAQKEMHFFGEDLRFGPQFYRRDKAAYLATFASGQHHVLRGEASVRYLFSTRAAAEIISFNPRARAIIMLREPVEALYSMYFQLRLDGNEDLPTFEEALMAEPDRRAGRRIPPLAYLPQALLYRETFNYTEQVRRYFSAFGRERVHVIIYDDFARDQAGIYRDTVEFLGLDPQRATSDFKTINGCREVRWPALRAVVANPRVRSAAVAVGRRLPRPLLNAMREAESAVNRMNSRRVKRPPLGAELEAELKREFADEVASLSELLGRDLTFWSA
jgi:hypothetical protein